MGRECLNWVVLLKGSFADSHLSNPQILHIPVVKSNVYSLSTQVHMMTTYQHHESHSFIFFHVTLFSTGVRILYGVRYRHSTEYRYSMQNSLRPALSPFRTSQSMSRPCEPATLRITIAHSSTTLSAALCCTAVFVHRLQRCCKGQVWSSLAGNVRVRWISTLHKCKYRVPLILA